MTPRIWTQAKGKIEPSLSKMGKMAKEAGRGCLVRQESGS